MANHQKTDLPSNDRRPVRKTRKCWTCGQEHGCYEIRPDHGWRPWLGQGAPWYVQPPKDVDEPCGGCGKPRIEHHFDDAHYVTTSAEGATS